MVSFASLVVRIHLGWYPCSRSLSFDGSSETGDGKLLLKLSDKEMKCSAAFNPFGAVPTQNIKNPILVTSLL